MLHRLARLSKYKPHDSEYAIYEISSTFADVFDIHIMHVADLHLQQDLIVNVLYTKYIYPWKAVCQNIVDFKHDL